MKPRNQYLDLLKKCLTAYIYDESWEYPLERPNTNVWHPREFVKWTAFHAFNLMNMKVVRRRPVDLRGRENGVDWPGFGYTMVGLKRLDNVQDLIEDVVRSNVPGDLVETGVWRGGCTIFMKAVLNELNVHDRMVWLADSFDGLPKPSPDYPMDKNFDLSNISFLKVSVDQVKRNFERFGLLDDNVRFLEGWFKDTLPTAPIERIALLRLDGDIYESTMDVLKALYSKVSPGGYVIVDDYQGFPVCRQAVDEYRAAHGVQAPIHDIDGSAIYWKV